MAIIIFNNIYRSVEYCILRHCIFSLDMSDEILILNFMHFATIDRLISKTQHTWTKINHKCLSTFIKYFLPNCLPVNVLIRMYTPRSKKGPER